MKSFTISALALVSVAHGQNLFESLVGHANNFAEQVSDSVAPISQKVSKNKFGCLVEESIYPHPHVEKTIKAPLVPFHMDYVQQEAHITNINKSGKKLKAGSNGGDKPTTPIYTCSDRAPLTDPNDFGMLLPVFAAQVSADTPKGTYAGHCFEKISFEY